MPPEGYLDIFGPDRNPAHEPRHEPDSEKIHTQDLEPCDCPLVIDGKLGETDFSHAIQKMRALRAEKPLLTDAALIRDAYSKFDLHGNDWKAGFRWAFEKKLIPAKKELTPTIKPVRDQKSLRRFGGNPNADKALPPERE